MLTLRRTNERGHAEHGWLTSFHTFSFAGYHDPAHMGFRDLRVINEDFIAGGQGFPTHPHRDMEIITYVVEGELAHKDTLGNSTVIRPGEVQRMSAGTGIKHSEFNHRSDLPTHLLQIWILPAEKNLPPGYGQRSFADAFRAGGLVLTVSRDGRDGSITINQDVDLYVGKWERAGAVEFKPRAGRGCWLQVVKGPMSLNHLKMENGDGAAIADESLIQIASPGAAEFLLFDLP